MADRPRENSLGPVAMRKASRWRNGRLVLCCIVIQRESRSHFLYLILLKCQKMEQNLLQFCQMEKSGSKRNYRNLMNSVWLMAFYMSILSLVSNWYVFCTKNKQIIGPLPCSSKAVDFTDNDDQRSLVKWPTMISRYELTFRIQVRKWSQRNVFIDKPFELCFILPNFS